VYNVGLIRFSLCELTINLHDNSNEENMKPEEQHLSYLFYIDTF